MESWACLFSNTINTVDDVRWKAARLHFMLSRRSSCINTSLSGLVSCIPLYFFIIQKSKTTTSMCLFCPFIQKLNINGAWFFRPGTQNISDIWGMCGLLLCSEVKRKEWAMLWCSGTGLSRYKRFLRKQQVNDSCGIVVLCSTRRNQHGQKPLCLAARSRCIDECTTPRMYKVSYWAASPSLLYNTFPFYFQKHFGSDVMCLSSEKRQYTKS